ncbi:MAG: hypothetical protein ACYDGS_03190 [Thermoleophilia bacterium]
MGIINNLFFGSPYSLKNYPKQEIELSLPDLKKYIDHFDLRMRFALMIKKGGLEAIKQYFTEHIVPRDMIYREVMESDLIKGLTTGSIPDHPMRALVNEQIDYFNKLVKEPSWGFHSLSEKTINRAGSAIGTLVIDGYACALTEKQLGLLPRRVHEHFIISLSCKDFLIHITAENWKGEPGADLKATKPLEEKIVGTIDVENRANDNKSKNPFNELLPPLGSEPVDSFPMWKFCRYFLDYGFYRGCMTLMTLE